MKIYVGNTRYKILDANGRRMMIAANSKPYDAEIEYLESTGTQYIDTGIVPSVENNTEVNVVVAPSVINNNQFFGANSNLNANINNIGKWRFNGVTTTADALIDTFYNITLKQTSSGRYYKIDNTAEGYGSKVSTANHFLICSLAGSNYKFSGKIKSVFIKENGVKVIDLIPVRVGNVGYMYDKISGELFGNSGTDSFILGNDK